MLKWIAALLILLLIGLAGLALMGPSILLNHPRLLREIADFRDPSGPTREIRWTPGPEMSGLSPRRRRPNVVVILVDDLGWNDLSWNGGGVAGASVETPNIDSLARDGVEFTFGYAGNATCAPSRAAILTGRYPPRFGFESTPAPPALGKLVSTLSTRNSLEGQPQGLFFEDRMGEVPPMEEQGIPPEELTLAELLKAEGYRTLMLGKWHLGESDGQRPTEQGFDEFLGFYSGASLYGSEEDPQIVNSKQDFDPIDQFLWQVLDFSVRKDEGERFPPPEYMTDYLSREAVRAIEANRHRPFFLYLAYNAPHTPLQAKKSDYDALSGIRDHKTRVYGAMIRALDRGVGEVLDALRANGLEKNTLVIFSSDNGGAHYLGIPDVNAPYRGWKMTFFEGGLHSPFFMKWPDRLMAGREVDTAISHIDVFSTVASATGADLPRDRVIDGVDLLPFAKGEAEGEAHEALFWRSGGLQVAMSEGWKFQIDRRQQKRWLFNLEEDPTERENLIATRGDRAAALEAQLEAFNEDVGPRHFPALIEGVVPIDRTIADPYRPGEEWAYWPN